MDNLVDLVEERQRRFPDEPGYSRFPEAYLHCHQTDEEVQGVDAIPYVGGFVLLLPDLGGKGGLSVVFSSPEEARRLARRILEWTANG